MISNELKDTATIKLSHDDIIGAVKIAEEKLINTLKVMAGIL